MKNLVLMTPAKLTLLALVLIIASVAPAPAKISDF